MTTLRRPTSEIAPEFEGGDEGMAALVEFREFCCGVRFDTEIAAVGDAPLWDLRLGTA